MSQQKKEQEHPNSPVFRDYKPPENSKIFKRTDNSYQLWQGYFLIKDANEGNPFAEHELGLRYLTGDGFPVDTPKSIYWIKKAADKNLPAADYNYAIFLHNGWGVDWNPFEAYNHFMKAAEKGMVEAEYIVGLLLTDNLVVSKNLSEAYKYIKKAAASGFKPAKDVLKEFHKNGIGIGIDSSLVTQTDSSGSSNTGNVVDASWGINYFDLSTGKNDSLSSKQQVDDKTLLKEVLKAGREELRVALDQKAQDSDSLFEADTTSIELIRQAAQAGSPEAQTLMGRCYEKGLGVKKDIVMASVEYIRSIREDSPRGQRLLWFLLQQQKGYFDLLKARIIKKDPDAEFAYAALVALRYTSQITEADALKLLVQAASKKHIAAVNELALCYYTGNLVKQDKQKAIEIWKRAAKELKSEEANVRLAVANIQDGFRYEKPEASIKKLQKASSDGSLLAQVALAHCYEKGIAVKFPDKAKAIRLYRLSAQRGSQGAYRALRGLYDEIRPTEDKFAIHGE
ncbi:MAG: tetratricopeptide repeat protein [Bacteroidota bacterium]|nr:tetratricopeptide repeat protein [Bacteroidota bacterium]